MILTVFNEFCPKIHKNAQVTRQTFTLHQAGTPADPWLLFQMIFPLPVTITALNPLNPLAGGAPPTQTTGRKIVIEKLDITRFMRRDWNKDPSRRKFEFEKKTFPYFDCWYKYFKFFLVSFL